MGITGTQYVVFRHKDQPHGHVHIVYNRVRNDGTAITGDSNFRKSIAVTKALTREYGLTFGKGKKNVRRERLRGKDAVKYRLYDAIREAMKNSHDWQSLRAALEAKGIRMAVVQRAGGSGRTGIIFTYGKMTFFRRSDRPEPDLQPHQSGYGGSQPDRCRRRIHAQARANRRSFWRTVCFFPFCRY